MVSSLEAFILLRSRVKGGEPMSRMSHHSSREKKPTGRTGLLKMSLKYPNTL